MPRIYVIDDHEDSREVAAAWLSGQGFSVTAFASAEEAYESLPEDPADLVLTDVMLPGMSGTELATSLQRDPRFSRIPVVALTGRSDISKEPFAALVLKPFEPDRLAKLMRKILESGPDRGGAREASPSLGGAARLPETVPRAPAVAPVELSDAEYRSVLEGAPMMAWRAGVDGGRDWFSPAWLAFTGRSIVEEVGERWLEGVHPDDLVGVVAALRASVESGGPLEIEHRLRRADGEYHWFATRAAPRFAEDGRAIGFVGFTFDIDGRRALEEAKSSFLRMMAHEMRTPLTPLSAYLHQLRRSATRGEAPSEDLLGRLDRQLQRVVSLIQHLGEAGRLATGAPLISTPEPFDLSALLGRVVADHRARERDTRGAPKHMYESRGLETPAPLEGDERQLDRAFEHVLSNAKKFSPDGCVIEIGLARLDEYYEVEVMDRGIGIPEDDIAQVGRPYFRGRNAPIMNYPGVGLGLAMASEIMKAHGGGLRVERRIGGGTRVKMTISRRGIGGGS